MSKTGISEQIEWGDAIFDRLSTVTIPPALKGPVATFRKAHGEYGQANGVVGEARKVRDKALDEVGAADDGLDPSVDELANALVGAGMGKRANPFQGLCKHSPSILKDLPYATEAEAVLDLVAKLSEKKGLSPAVAKAAATCKKNAEAVNARLRALSAPQAEYSKALAARDGLLPDYLKALRKLKTHAKAAWDDEPGTYAAVFAPRDKVQAPKKPAAKKPAKKAKTAETGPDGAPPK